MPSIWWIRRDVRLADNPALAAALLHGNGVIPLFIIDPSLAKPEWQARNHFLFQGVAELGQSLQKLGSGLVIRFGKPQQVLLQILAETGADAIFAEEDTTPTARKRDGAVAESMPLTLVHGQTVHPPMFVTKDDGLPYTVYTPFPKNGDLCFHPR